MRSHFDVNVALFPDDVLAGLIFWNFHFVIGTTSLQL